nr:MAG TPA: hypothetical protein [Bacteriophage sp.]
MTMRLLSAGFADSSRKGKTYNGCIFGSGRCTAPHCEDSQYVLAGRHDSGDIHQHFTSVRDII